jgi:type VI secretion system secreted protein VgrG
VHGDRRIETIARRPKKISSGSRTGTDPVEAFTTPVVVLDTPSTAIFATEAGMASFTGQDSSIAVQGDAHQTAAHTWASVSGKTSS